MKLLLIGSSIMEQWAMPDTMFPSNEVVNRAVGGTTTTYWADHVTEVVTQEAPDAVFAYVGSNDIVQPLPPVDIARGVGRLRKLLSLYSETLPFAYLAIIKAPQRREHFEDIESANRIIRQRLSPGDLWLETDPVFLDSDGAPRHDLYVEDGLHLKPATYGLLTQHISTDLLAWLDARQTRSHSF